MALLRILLIEDDPNLGYVLQESLELHDFSVTLCRDGEAGYTAFVRGDFHLALIDIMLPKKDGFALARDMRRVNGDLPIIFLTAKAMKEDKIEGFTIGADDYITKPFSLEELILRIRAVLRRAGNDSAQEAVKVKFAVGDFQFDYENRTLRYRNEAKVKLTHTESELLRLFCLNINQIVSRDLALAHIWKDNSFFASRSMDVYVSKLRKLLVREKRVEIVNVHSRGFKMILREHSSAI